MQSKLIVTPQSAQPVLKGKVIPPDNIDSLQALSAPAAFPLKAYFNANKSALNLDDSLPANQPATVELISLTSGQVLKTMPVNNRGGHRSLQIPTDYHVAKGTIIVVRLVQGKNAVSQKVIY